MNDQQLNADLELFRDNLRRYLAAEIEPHYEQWETDEISPRNIWNMLGEQGYLSVDIPQQYGGYGANFLFSMAVLEEMAYANFGALASSVSVHSDIVSHYVLNHGSEEQKQGYLPRMVTGECVGAIAMTEPGCGSDLQGMKTNARLDGHSWVINGSKTFITNGQHADMVIVAARTNMEQPGARGTSLFIVDRGTPGFDIGQNLKKMGQHSSDTSELFFSDVSVPPSALLGRLDKGFVILMSELQRERLSLVAGAVGAAEGILTSTIDYINDRKAFGKSVSEFQNSRFKIAEMATDIRMNRVFLEACKRDFANGQLTVEDVSMAKYASTEMQCRVADQCLQLHGGYGYMREYGVSRAYVDARVQRIYGGTSEIMLELISRSVLKN